MLVLIGATLSVLVILLFPFEAMAWAPGTHIEIGLKILSQLSSLPMSLSTLLTAFPDAFLYGLLACDFQLAKNIKGYSKNSHNWKLEAKLEAKASSPKERAFALGCRVHLASDVVCHNLFIPLLLVENFRIVGAGHAFFEAGFDTHMPHRAFKQVKRLSKMANTSLDNLHKQAFSDTLFPFFANQRIIQGLARLQRSTGWRNGMKRLGYSLDVIHLTRPDISYYMDKSVGLGLEALASPQRSIAMRADPTGGHAILEAKRIRRTLRRWSRRKIFLRLNIKGLSMAFRDALEAGLENQLEPPDPLKFIVPAGKRKTRRGNR
ncbi:MAG: zinc dependent phospholipase C family protein [Deltaproteobacteria bacterium]|nr:zinc dependent phospholipase C family protein [Deltaproteobacteria bacterium]